MSATKITYPNLPTGVKPLWPLSEKGDGPLLQQDGEVPFAEIDELQSLLADGRERGFLTVEEVAATLSEVEITKEEVSELRAYLDQFWNRSLASFKQAAEQKFKEKR